MAERITRESMELIGTKLINIIEEYRDYGSDSLTINAIKDYLESEGIIEVMPEYRYGMRLRGFSPGCQPKDGFLEREDDLSGKYYDVLVYNRKLTDRETEHYSLDCLEKEVK